MPGLARRAFTAPLAVPLSTRFRIGTTPGLGNAFPDSEIGMQQVDEATGMIHVAFNTRTVSLINGNRYYVTLEAVNGACPPLATQVYSKPILVDSDPPVPDPRFSTDARDPIFSNRECDFGVTSQTDTRTLHACWPPFLEPHSRVVRYTIAVMKQEEEDGGEHTGHPCCLCLVEQSVYSMCKERGGGVEQ